MCGQCADRRVGEVVGRDEDGLTIVEYAVAGGLITGAVVLAFTALGGAVQAEIERLTDAISDN